MTLTDEEAEELAIRLWAKSEEFGECILWYGATSGQMGYGTISFRGRQTYIHRLIYQLHNPEEILDTVRHTCDTPNCWNIDHLINGTTADNVDDKVSKLRHVFGSKNYNTKFEEADIHAIRESQQTIYQIAHQFGVTPSTIHYIRARKTWKHIK